MSRHTRRLGRGLDSLVTDLMGSGMVGPPAGRGVEVDNDLREETSNDDGVPSRMVSIGILRANPFQPRTAITEESVRTLAESIRRDGILQPIAVRPSDEGYEIIAGERRWAAAKSLGMTRVPVIIREASDQQMLELALIENIQREDLNAIDRATAYREFCNRFDLSAVDVAQRLGEDRSTVVNYLRLLELPREVQNRVATGEITMGHARSLAGVADDRRRIALAAEVIAKNLSVRALEELVKHDRHGEGGLASARKGNGRVRPAHLAELEGKLEERVKTKVTIQEGKRKGSGRIVIEFYTLDDFDRIAALFGIAAD